MRCQKDIRLEELFGLMKDDCFEKVVEQLNRIE